jgi:lipoic acid synthetase
VDHGSVSPLDPGEPERVAEAALTLGLHYVVVTSVTRDDLEDGGAECFAETIRQIRKKLPETQVEVLIPDFQGDNEALKKVVGARPDVLNHNIETVPRLYPFVRPGADYRRSLELLRNVKLLDASLTTKSGLMVGLGETSEEVRRTLQDMLEAGCSMLTLGQYLQPTPANLPVERFVPPEEFEKWRNISKEMGFAMVASGPFVRSSYHAGDLYRTIQSGHS